MKLLAAYYLAMSLYAEAQVQFKMWARVEETHANNETLYTDSLLVTWGMYRNSFEFIVRDKHLVYRTIKWKTREELNLEMKLESNKLENEKVYLRQDDLADRYVIRILSGNGYIIYINNISGNRLPVYCLNFNPRR